MNFIRSQQANTIAVVTDLINKLRIPVSPITIQNDLKNHPNYPSLLAVSDCLTDWKIPHEIYQIDPQNFKKEELYYPFIAHLNVADGKLILVDEIKKNVIKYSDEGGKKHETTIEQLINSWSGVIVYAHGNEYSGENNYLQMRIKGWIAQLALPLFVSVIMAYFLVNINIQGLNLPYLTLLILKLSGVIICVLLLIQSIDSNNPFIQNLCGLGKNNDCNAILKSKAARLTVWLNWSEIGMVYFTGSFCCLFIYPSSVNLLIWLSIICLPYTFYSIGYQLKMKNWCILCCSVQVLFWIEALVFILNYSFSPFNFRLIELFSFFLLFLFPTAIWVVLKSQLLKSSQTESLKLQLKKFKYNTEIFNKLLTNQSHYIVSDELMPVSLGNPNAKNVITMISNPFCGPCGITHKLLIECIENREDIQLKIIFATNNQDNENRTKVARHVFALNQLKNNEIVKIALDDWYEHSNKSYEGWADKYPVNIDEDLNAITEKQAIWCELAEIKFTPTILVNGYKLVNPYQVADLKHLLI